MDDKRVTVYGRSIHDVIYYYCCTICEEENLIVEAVYCCKDCSKFLCATCKKYHDKFTRKHRVLGRNKVAEWEDVKPVTGSLTCDKHHGNELEMFCEDHDCLCCHTCLSAKHRVCKEVKPVSQVAKGIQKKQGFKSFLSEADRTQSALKTLYDRQENNIKLLQKARGEITSILQDMRKQLNLIVDRLEEKSTQEMDKLLTILKEKITSDKNISADFYDKIQTFLQNVEKQFDELAFQGYKKCSEQVAKAEELISSMKDIDYKLEFTPDDKMLQYLSSLETFGSFQVTPSGLVDTLKNNDVTKPLISPDHVYSVVYKKKYNVKTSEDTEPCYITGMCQLPGGHIVIIDFYNSKVKLLNSSTCFVLGELKLPDSPRDICHTTGTEIAVAVYDHVVSREIQFIRVENGKLSHTRNVQIDCKCESIAYHDDHLYVSSRHTIDVYSLSGKKIKKFYEDTSGAFPTVYRLSFSDDCSKICVTNYDKHLLLTLDSSSQQLSTFSDFELQRPTGVCWTDNGSLFVCGEDSQTLLQVDREGRKKLNTLATQDDGVYMPSSLCYDRKNHTLLVGQFRNDSLLALQLK